MKKLTSFAIFILVLLLVTCSDKKATQNIESEIKIKIETQIINFPDSGEDTLKASFFADSIIYIPLETTPESLLGNLRHVWADDSVILIHDYNAGLFMFKTNGKFVRKIGKLGRGPGEYSGIFNFDVIHDTIYISPTNNRSLMRYTYEGAFCDEIKFNYQPVHFSHTADQKLACYIHGEGIVLVYNRNFYAPDTIVVEYGVTKGRYLWGYPMANLLPYFQKTPSGLLFNDFLNDTIWNITGDKKEPAYILEMKNKLPRDKQIEFCNGNFEAWENIAKSYERIHFIPFTSLTFIVQKQWDPHVPYKITYIENNKTGEIRRFNTNVIRDDIVSKGNVAVSVHHKQGSAEYLFASTGMVRNLERYRSRKNASPLFLDQIKNVKEDDNPIFALIKLKKEMK